jgi:hypothetical protein
MYLHNIYIYIYTCYGEECVSSQFNECSGLFPLISNPGADNLTGILNVSALLKVGILVCVQQMSPFPSDSFWGDPLRVFEDRIFLVGRHSGEGRLSEVVSAGSGV